MRIEHSKRSVILLLAFQGIFPSGVRASDWTHLGGDPAHTGMAVQAPSGLSNVAWSAQPLTAPGTLERFVWRGGSVATSNRVFITAREYVDDGLGSYEHTTNAVICYDARTGERLWDTDIDADLFEYDSWATPALDLGSGTVVVASHFSIFALSMVSGDIVWERELPNVLVNASPTVSANLTVNGVPANRVFITDYTGFEMTGGGIYAINCSPFHATDNPYQPGEIAWQDRTLPGTVGNTAAYADGYVYVGTSSGIIRRYEAICGGVCGQPAACDWETDTEISQTQQYAGFYGGVAVRDNHVFAAAYAFYGTGNSSAMFKLSAATGDIVWEVPCERTDTIPVVAQDGRIFLAAGIDGFGSAVKVQAFQDNGATVTQLWDTYNDTSGQLIVGGWTHHPLLAQGILYCGTPDDAQFFGPYTNLYAVDVSLNPSDPGFIVEHAAGSGGTPAAVGDYLYSLGTSGLVAYAVDHFGDLNCDNVLNFDDVEPFVLALIDPSAYADAYESCDIHRADLNRDGREDGADVQSFVAKLLSP